MHPRVTLPALLLVLGLSSLPTAQAAPSNDEIKQQMIEESIAAYDGNCPCPYNTMRNGRSCGKRSAWSRPGGESPLCYKNDISDEEAAAWRQQHSE